MTRFNAPLEYKRTQDSTRAGAGISRFAGMPVGIQAMSDWVVQHLQFIKQADLPDETNDWTMTVVDGGGDAADTRTIVTDGSPPRLAILNNDADNDSTQLQFTAANGAGEWIDLVTDRPAYFEIMLRLSDATLDDDTVEQVAWFAGLANTDATVLAGAADFVGFLNRDLDDDAPQDISLVCGNAGGTLIAETLQRTGWTTLNPDATSAASTAAGTLLRRNQNILGPDDWIKLAFLLEPGTAGAQGRLYWWVNDIWRGHVDVAGNVPNQNVCLTLAVENGEAVAHTLEVAYVILAQRYTDEINALVGSETA